MIKAVLLDLDDTHQLNPDQQFVPAYLKCAEDYFATKHGWRGVSAVLAQAPKAMMASPSTEVPNIAVAHALIAEAVAQPVDVIRRAFETFYREAYPALRGCTRPVDVAPRLVETLRKRGYEVAIATNPLYPTEAISQRLAWAGLADLDVFITTGDNMHFIKPQPEYYAETIARVGVEPDEALMVGNSTRNDIAPAATLGLYTYLVGEGNTLADFIAEVDDGWLDTLHSSSPTQAMILPELWGNTGALHGMLAEVLPHQWHQRPLANEWSIYEVVCHLLEREVNIQRPRLQHILDEDNPFLPPAPEPIDPANGFEGRAGIDVARAFVAERQKTLDLLRNLTAEQWQRPARHSIFSITSLLEMAHFTAQHDRMHLTQICQTLGRCD